MAADAAPPRAPDLPFVTTAEALRAAGRHGDALAALREGERAHPDHLPARVVLARVQVDLGNRALAAEVLADVLRADPSYLDAAVALARLHLAEGRAQAARRLLPTLAGRAPPELLEAIAGSALPPGSDPFDQPARARRLAERGDHRAARRIWLRLLERAPGNAAIEAELARLPAGPASAAPSGDTLPAWTTPARSATIRAIRAWADRVLRDPPSSEPG